MDPLTFSTVLLVGGKSRRMGRDKALLPTGKPGQLLWQRQWKLLEQLQPKELFWSGPPRPGAPSTARLVDDVVENAGPLAGISVCLDLMFTDLILVLAVDLPEMSPALFLNLLGSCGKKCGAVYQHNDFFEPLAGIYPKSLARLAAQHLALGRYSMQDLIREGIKQELMLALPMPEEALPCFKNVNTPGDL